MAKTSTKTTAWKGAFAAFSSSLEQITKNPGPALFFVAIYLVASVVSMAIQGKTTYVEEGYVPYADALTALFIVPIIMYSLSLVDKKPFTVSDFMQIEPRKLLLTIGASILIALAVLGSAIALIIPVIWTLAWFMLAIFPTAENGISPVAALKESKRISQQHKGKVWAIIGVEILVVILGALFSVIPFFGVIAVAFVTIWTTAATAELYRWLQKR